MFLLYITLSFSGFTLITWLFFRAIQQFRFPPHNDDDGGGIPPHQNLPIIDTPPSNKITDLLVDRWYEDIHQQKNA
ncbi:MAG: hypothetical protein EAZ55_07435 [Cytophagales bacterium]|nr:MAG: hypothetical protein EAZ55_07435 [Cytophagales bacterium]